jgi:hypothetical protein
MCHHNYLVAKFEQALGEIINVIFNSSKIGVKEIRYHQNSVLLKLAATPGFHHDFFLAIAIGAA